MSKAYTRKEKVLFKHCDPAGIVFFPRHFEIINDCVEHFFTDVLNLPFEDLLTNGGAPTVQINTQFVAPSRHGEVLTLELVVIAVGRSSMSYKITTRCNRQTRMLTDATLVHVDNSGKPTPWPAIVTGKLKSLMETGK